MGINSSTLSGAGAPLDVTGVEPALKEELDLVTCVSQRLPLLLQVRVMRLSFVAKVRSDETPNSRLWQCLVHKLGCSAPHRIILHFVVHNSVASGLATVVAWQWKTALLQSNPLVETKIGP